MCPCDCDRISALAVNNCKVKAEVFEAPVALHCPYTADGNRLIRLFAPCETLHA